MSFSAQQETYPVGYFETMSCLNRPHDWDVPGMIRDIREYVRREAEVPNGQVLAVIDYLLRNQSLDVIRELNVACKVGLTSLRHGGIVGRSPETDTLENAIARSNVIIDSVLRVEKYVKDNA